MRFLSTLTSLSGSIKETKSLTWTNFEAWAERQAPTYTSPDCIILAESRVFIGPLVFRSVSRISSDSWNDGSQHKNPGLRSVLISYPGFALTNLEYNR